MIGVQLGVALLLRRIHAQPLRRDRVVAPAQLETLRLLRVAVEVVSDGLQPRVVRVARVIHVAPIHHLGLGALEQVIEQRVHLPLLLRFLFRRQVRGEGVARLLLELALHRRRSLLAEVHHAAWQRPFARVPALDHHHLKVSRLFVFARDDRVGGCAAEGRAVQEPV